MRKLRQLLGLVLLAGAVQGALAAAVDAQTGTVTIALSQEPPNLNSLKATDVVSGTILGHVSEGLVRYDRRGDVVPGVASSWTHSDTQLTFALRPEARWSDGSTVTAHDFVYAWQQLVTPATAAPYAAIMYPIKHAREVQAGEMPAEALGVKALGDHQLQVTLARPCGYCVSLMAHAAFYPIKAEFHQQMGDRYGAEADTLLYNGPFQLTRWVHDAELMMEKSPHYWNRETVQINRLHVAYITADNRARLNLYRDDSIAFATLGAETVADAVAGGLRVRTYSSGGLSYLRLNMRPGRPMAQLKLRQALQRVFDADEFVNKVIGIPGYKPAYSFFPGWLPGEKAAFIIEHPMTAIVRDQTAARQLVAEARKDYRQATGKALPPLTFLTVASPTGAKVAEYWQGLLKQQLGLEVRVDQQSFKQYLQKAAQGGFDLGPASWYPDFADIVTYADLLASWNTNNRGRYVSAEYDAALQVLLEATDSGERMQAAVSLQAIIARDVAVIPMAETGAAYVQHPRLKGVGRSVLGPSPDFTGARILP